MRTKGSRLIDFFPLLFFAVSGSYPTARNVTWESTNFKTILSWQPLPSHYSYTVEFSVLGRSKERNRNCIRTSTRTCDLTYSLMDVKACYVAYILSEPPLGVTSDLTEFPYTKSSTFCPYQDTDIGRVEFKLEVSKDKKTTWLMVTDPLTALFQDDQQLSIRDIFSEKLEYKVTYRRNKSTGKKVYISKSNVMEIPDLDHEESYCFTVQAFIPSRRTDKQLGKPSQTQCSEDHKHSILEVYSVGVIAGGILLVLLLMAVITVVTTVCCRRRKKREKSEKEGVPLQSV
uniref:coagulation factor IIIa n=1 Tax=Doryrhamphus excisus TaxID=161450 RepID=UPI0025AEA9D1|nr:coagulation factor IIIa [Doryrhamphus excisus]